MLKALYAEWGGEYKMRTVGPVTAPDSGTGHTEKAQVLDGLAAALRPRQFSAEARHAVVSKVIMLAISAVSRRKKGMLHITWPARGRAKLYAGLGPVPKWTHLGPHGPIWAHIDFILGP